MLNFIARFAHTLSYATIYGAYAGYCGGLDSTLVAAVVAVAYLALALPAFRQER